MNVTGLLLAGGCSRRLGKDKRFLGFRGRPLILRAYQAASAVAEEIWVLLADPRDGPKVREALGDRPLRFVFDPEPGAGPLGALVGALERLDPMTEWALLLAVDYPLLTGEFLKAFKLYAEANARGADVLVPLSREVPQVACAFYRRSLREELRDAFAQGERSLRRFVEGLPPKRVLRVPEEAWRAWAEENVFLSVNTPEDYARLLRADQAAGLSP